MCHHSTFPTLGNANRTPFQSFSQKKLNLPASDQWKTSHKKTINALESICEELFIIPFTSYHWKEKEATDKFTDWPKDFTFKFVWINFSPVWGTGSFTLLKHHLPLSSKHPYEWLGKRGRNTGESSTSGAGAAAAAWSWVMEEAGENGQASRFCSCPWRCYAAKPLELWCLCLLPAKTGFIKIQPTLQAAAKCRILLVPLEGITWAWQETCSCSMSGIELPWQGPAPGQGCIAGGISDRICAVWNRPSLQSITESSLHDSRDLSFLLMMLKPVTFNRI